jgi:flagellar biosynthesis regulator FlbT
MPLKISLKPKESIHIGRSRITVVSAQISTLLIDGEAPVLRSDQVIAAEAAQTPLQELHLVLQRMYLEENVEAHHARYFTLAAQLMIEAPELAQDICTTNQLLLDGFVYEAVKLIAHMSRQSSLPGMTRPHTGASSRSRRR